MVRINLAEKQHKSTEYKKVQPLGLVPAMEMDGETIYESTALVGYLADKYPDKKMAPAVTSKERAKYWQWLVFATTSVEPHVMSYFTHSSKLPEDKRRPEMVTEALANFREAAEVVEKALAGKEFLVGNAFTAADILMASSLMFAKALGMPVADFSSIPAYLDRCKSRPAFKKAIAD